MKRTLIEIAELIGVLLVIVGAVKIGIIIFTSWAAGWPLIIGITTIAIARTLTK